MELSFKLESHLTSSQTACLLEAGLTFILYQRGQIPLPYNQLQTSAQEAGRSVSGDGICTPAFKNMTSCDGQSQNSSSPDEIETASELNPRQRISLMIQERRGRLKAQKLEKMRRLNLIAESKAYNAIEPALEVLRRLLSDAMTRKATGQLFDAKPYHRPRIVSMVLLLGPSIYSPKEIYQFELPYQLISDDSSCKTSQQRFQNTVLRQFYKKIITSSDFMDFTGKQLGKTYAHICVISSGDLKFALSDKYYNSVVRLPSVPSSLNEIINSFHIEASQNTESESDFPTRDHFPPVYSKKIINKCFTVKLDGKYIEQESIDVDGTSFSSDILFDSNSFFCYQIPLRFKGLQSRTKRL